MPNWIVCMWYRTQGISRLGLSRLLKFKQQWENEAKLLLAVVYRNEWEDPALNTAKPHPNISNFSEKTRQFEISVKRQRTHHHQVVIRKRKQFFLWLPTNRSCEPNRRTNMARTFSIWLMTMNQYRKKGVDFHVLLFCPRRYFFQVVLARAPPRKRFLSRSINATKHSNRVGFALVLRSCVVRRSASIQSDIRKNQGNILVANQ